MGSGGVYADSGGVEADLYWRLYQMIPIRGEMFAADTSEPWSIIVAWRWILSVVAQAGRTLSDTFT